MAVTRPITQPRYELEISNDYQFMVGAVLPSLGWSNPEEAGVPALEQVQAGIESVTPLTDWLATGAS